MDVLVGRRELHALHVHPDGDHLALVRTAVHYLELDQRFCFGLGGGAGSEGLLADEGDLHALDLYLDEVEVDASDDDVPQVVEGLVVLEVDVQAVLNPHFHLHRHHLSLTLHALIRQQHCEVLLLRRGEFVVLQHDHPDEVAHSAGDAVEGLVLLLKVGELELVGLVLGHDAGGLHFLGERGELGRQILVGVYLCIGPSLPKKPMRKHLMPRCSYFLVSLSDTLIVPLISSFLLNTGSLILSLPLRILWYF